MRLTKKTVFTVILVLCASSAYAATKFQSDRINVAQLCDSDILKCELILKGNGSGKEPPLPGTKRKRR